MNLRRVTNLEITYQKMRMVIYLQIPTIILNRWNNYFCQLLKVCVYGINIVTQTEMHTAEP